MVNTPNKINTLNSGINQLPEVKSSVLNTIKINEYEQFKDLESVKRCRNIIERAITKNELYKLDDTIYDMLTSRNKYINESKKYTSEVEFFKTKDKEKTQYENNIDILEKSLLISPNYIYNKGDTWFGINTNPTYKGKIKQNYDYKMYLTVDMENSNFLANIPEILTQLRAINFDKDTDTSNDGIQIKFPTKYLTFLKHNDSIVIHFKNKENAGKLQEVLNNWTFKNNIKSNLRDLNRTTIAGDSNGKSFSEMISNTTEKYIKDLINENKYNPQVISKAAIEFAIRESQKPNINGYS